MKQTEVAYLRWTTLDYTLIPFTISWLRYFIFCYYLENVCVCVENEQLKKNNSPAIEDGLSRPNRHRKQFDIVRATQAHSFHIKRFLGIDAININVNR